MDNEQIKSLENQIETSLKEFSKDVAPKIGQINKFLDQEYEKEINDQINFLRNIAVMAGVVAPLSLTLLSEGSVGVQDTFLLLGFISLLLTVLITLLYSKKITLDKKYKDTTILAFNHIIARCLIDDLSNPEKSLSDRANVSAEILKSIDDINNKFSDLGYTNKLADLRNRISRSNQWSIFLFSLGLIFIIISVVFIHIVDLLTFLLSLNL